MRAAFILVLLLIVPILEIACFIVVGGAIGIGWTLLLILVTAVIGTMLLRVQGLGLIARIRGEVRAGRVPAREMVHGLMLALAGVLLLTPGFVTDTVGFALFVPPLRDAVWNLVRGRVTTTLKAGVASAAMGGMKGGAGGPPPGRRGRGTIDLDEQDYRRTDPTHDAYPDAPADGAGVHDDLEPDDAPRDIGSRPSRPAGQ